MLPPASFLLLGRAMIQHHNIISSFNSKQAKDWITSARTAPVEAAQVLVHKFVEDIWYLKEVHQVMEGNITTRVTKILILQRVICLIKITILMEERATLMGYKWPKTPVSWVEYKSIKAASKTPQELQLYQYQALSKCKEASVTS